MSILGCGSFCMAEHTMNPRQEGLRGCIRFWHSVPLAMQLDTHRCEGDQDYVKEFRQGLQSEKLKLTPQIRTQRLG